MKKLILIVASFNLCACGFHFRNKSTLPADMNSINITSNNSSLRSALQDTFNSIQVKSSMHSPYQLDISNYNLRQSNPSIVIQGAPVTVTYSLTVTAQLSQQHKTLATKTFSSSQSIIQNINSLQVSRPKPSLILQFQNDIVEQIYLWLSSQSVKQQLRSTNAT